MLTIAGLLKLHTRSAPVPDLKVASTPEQIQRGQAIANSFCGACHSKTGPLTGGVDIGKDFPIPVGSFVSSNLTPAGHLSYWSESMERLFEAFYTTKPEGMGMGPSIISRSIIEAHGGRLWPAASLLHPTTAL